MKRYLIAVACAILSITSCSGSGDDVPVTVGNPYLPLIPEGVDGRIVIMADRPWTSQGGIELGTMEIKRNMPQVPTDMAVELPAAASLTGKHAIFLKFESDEPDTSICVLNSLIFK